ncbi:MAG: hypothetical protein WBI44_10460 [Syntrophaceticus sp.]
MKRERFVILLVVSLLMVTALTGFSNTASASSVSQNEQTEVATIEPQATRDYYFSHIVPAFGNMYDPRNFTMTAGKYCRVQRIDTSYGNVSFRVVDYNTLSPLGGWIKVDRGQTKLIYTNTSGRTQNVRIQLSAVLPAQIHAKGYFKFGEF